MRKRRERANLDSALVAGLLAGRHLFKFRNLGSLSLKGFPTALDACEVLYERADGLAALHRPAFIGRAAEVARLTRHFEEIQAGCGALVMLVGEPGIGKTRILEEFANIARTGHAAVLWGRCYEGEWAPPYGPFSEAITEYVLSAEPEELRQNLGFGAPPLARLVSVLRERLSDIGEPVPLQPEEERFRLLDAASQLFIAISKQAPLVIVLDDLHWADGGTIAMLRHTARFVSRNRILILGAYRDVELDRRHPLADALGALRRESPFERILLKGLHSGQVAELLHTMAEEEVPKALVEAIGTETDGNPFFIREVLMHLVEEKKLFRQDGQWNSNLTIEEMGIPEGIRQVIGRRLARLSDEANRFLAAASAFNGDFRLDIVADVAGMDEAVALGAVDEALAAQLIRPGSQSEWFEFTHALFRHMLYAELSPPRQVRLHRQIAEAMERIWLERVSDHVAEIAYHYSRSGVLSGAERGVAFAIAAADRAEATYAHDDVATFVRIALELAPDNDPRRPRLFGQLGLAYTLTLKFAEALKAAAAGADLIASSEGDAAAADYLAVASTAMRQTGYEDGAGVLASQGLRFTRDRRDATWASLTMMDIMREEVQDPDYPGMSVDSPRWRELYKILEDVPPEQDPTAFWGAAWWPFASRDELLTSTSCNSPTMLSFFAGEYRQAVPLWEDLATQAEREGRIVAVLLGWAQAARCHTALGNFDAARAAYQKGREARSRLNVISTQVIQLVTAKDDTWLALGEGWDPAAAGAALGRQSFALKYNAATYRAATARAYAHLGMIKQALDLLRTLVRPLELAPGWVPNFTRMACDAASAVWLLNHVEEIEVIERNLRQKVVAPDFRYPMQDGRLSLARLCGLRGHYDEAAYWFAQSRVVLEQQGARPLRAIADFDEAIMYLRRNEDGDRHRAAPLLSAAIMNFRALGMTGWLRRAASVAF
jgi:tetratricopeptide (TPR) repeat protein